MLQRTRPEDYLLFYEYFHLNNGAGLGAKGLFKR